MQKLIIAAALLTCAFAAPLEHKDTLQIEELPRPSPINPDIPSDPKPAEKVTLISEAEKHQLHQHKAEVQPPRIPAKLDAHREKRDQKHTASKEASSSSSSEEDSTEEKKSHHTKITKPESNSTPQDTTSTVTSSPTQTRKPTAARRPYSPLIHQHNEHLFKPTTKAVAHPTTSSSGDSTTAPSTSTSSASVDHVSDKRDIPVPLTRKHQPVDDDAAVEKKSDATKPSEEEAKPENVKHTKTKDDADTKPAEHLAIISHPIPVAELFAKKHPTTD